MNPLIAASTNRVYYTPSTYPLTSLTLTLTRDGTSVAYSGSITADATNSRYYLDLISSECLVGTYKFAWALTSGTQTRTDVEYYECVEVEPAPHLATPTDLLAFGYGTTGVDYLGRASARVRREYAQTVTRDSSSITLYYPFVLPQRPVVSIDSITDEDSNAIDSDDYDLKGQYIVLDSIVEPILVTYTHGYASVPEGIREVVCSIAYRTENAKAGLEQGLTSEGADGESIGYGSDAYAGVAGLTSQERKALARYFPKLPRAVDIL